MHKYGSVGLAFIHFAVILSVLRDLGLAYFKCVITHSNSYHSGSISSSLFLHLIFNSHNIGSCCQESPVKVFPVSSLMTSSVGLSPCRSPYVLPHT